ncbi:MAG: SMP-30/gluconolactonase/LRE family protein [Anaerolineales bacterium]|nr:SMP-30/gluconolactonase/LRE family protein [Anaerolineales bacterium]
MNAELLFDAKAELGEGPAWDEKTQTLYWLDILQKRIYANENLLAELDDYVACLAPTKSGNLLIGKRAALADFAPDSAQETFRAAVSDSAKTRLNDGKCDPAGRFLFGTMDLEETEPIGAFYSYDGKALKKLFDGVTISNGLTWSPDYKTFYYIDTPACEVRAYDYDLATGEIANRRRAFAVPRALGWADGMTSDREGNLWIAMWGGAQLTRWNPNSGQLLQKIPLPVLQPSCPAFGGKNCNELFITSARKGMSQAQLNQYPLSGGLFKLETDVEGLSAFEFEG